MIYVYVCDFMCLGFRVFKRWDINVSIRECGFVVTGFTFYMQTWVIERKGPVFLGLSTPLAFIFTTVFAALLIGEIISLGRYIKYYFLEKIYNCFICWGILISDRFHLCWGILISDRFHLKNNIPVTPGRVI
ncbi:hypothetical protein HanHA300_Chr09g0316591 [Helianthus annuus]|nr:hypothetical protein HanHA300_Chr09g0316591 [Helianthus annuus]KAJ0542231.1 hypothetical protein HanHA89_Chr09g0337491 [Helianthus annuus]